VATAAPTPAVGTMTIPALAPARGPVVAPTADLAKTILTAGPALAPVAGEVLPMADLAKTIRMAGPALALALAVVEVGVIPMGVLAARTIRTAGLEPVPAPAAGRAAAPMAVQAPAPAAGRVVAPMADQAKTTPMADRALAPAAGRVVAPMVGPAKTTPTVDQAPAPVAGAAGEIPMAGPARMIHTADLALVDGVGAPPAGSAGAMMASGTLEINLLVPDEAQAAEGGVGGREVVTERMIPMALEGGLAVDRMIRPADNSTKQTTILVKSQRSLSHRRYD